jgi:cytochrome c peroxidase
MKKLLIILCISLLLFASCHKQDENFKPLSLSAAMDDEEILGGTVNKKTLIMPLSTDFDNIPQDPNNPLSTEKVQLGQLLFHETKLSAIPNSFKVFLLIHVRPATMLKQAFNPV